MNENIRISMFGHKRIPSREGGVEIVVQELAVRMSDLGNEVTCYNRRGHHISGKEFDEQNNIQLENVRIKTVPTIEKKGLAAVSSSFFGALYSSFGKYDVVHIHAEGPAAFCWLPKLFGKKVIVTVHGLDWQREKWKDGFGSKYIHLGEKMAAKHANEIIVLSKAVQDYFMSTYSRKTHFIPNGVIQPKKLEANIIKTKWGLEKDNYILYLGRIVPEKGEHYLIEAFRKINTDKKLVIAGGASDTDTYLKKLKVLAEKDDRIIFTGFVQGDSLKELYSNAYIYCLPSDLEGMPLSLLEAMSFGNCCLTSDIPECSDVIESYGVTFEKGNIDDLKKRLDMLCADAEMVHNYKNSATDFICSKYMWDAIVKKTLELYKGNQK